MTYFQVTFDPKSSVTVEKWGLLRHLTLKFDLLSCDIDLLPCDNLTSWPLTPWPLTRQWSKVTWVWVAWQPENGNFLVGWHWPLIYLHVTLTYLRVTFAPWHLTPTKVKSHVTISRVTTEILRFSRQLTLTFDLLSRLVSLTYFRVTFDLMVFDQKNGQKSRHYQ